MRVLEVYCPDSVVAAALYGAHEVVGLCIAVNQALLCQFVVHESLCREEFSGPYLLPLAELAI